MYRTPDGPAVQSPGGTPQRAAESAAADPPGTDTDTLFGSLMDALREGATLKDVYGLSGDALESVYAYAYEFYQQGRLDEAEAFFRFLCIYDFHNVDYALGLGAVFQLRKEYDKAIDIYGIAYTLGGNDERALFYAGQCNLLTGRLGKARRCFELVMADGTDAAMLRNAAAYLALIEKSAAPAAADPRGATRSDKRSEPDED